MQSTLNDGETGVLARPRCGQAALRPICIIRKKQNAEIAEYADKKKLGVLCDLGGKFLGYSSSSFTSPRSDLAFSMIFSCSCAGTTS